MVMKCNQTPLLHFESDAVTGTILWHCAGKRAAGTRCDVDICIPTAVLIRAQHNKSGWQGYLSFNQMLIHSVLT